MLYGRFLRISRTFGAASEAVLRRSQNRAALETGYLPMEPGFGKVRRIGSFVANGAMDSGAWLTGTQWNRYGASRPDWTMSPDTL